jgi:hypothetical protein
MKLAALIVVSASLAYAHLGAPAQDSPASRQNPAQPYNESGETSVQGAMVPYLVRRLPVDSFPDLPDAVAEVLKQRGCLIPQTYQAHHPENVIHAAFERPGSSDWAVLCSVHGKVDLLVFFARNPTKPVTLASALEVERLQRHDLTGVFGFDWGIDPASPEQVREAQAGLQHHPPALDHDALEDTLLNEKTVYRYFAHNTWTILEMPQ